MLQRAHIFYCIFFSLLFSLKLFPQLPGQFIEQSLQLKTPFTVVKYSAKEGLPQNQVLNIFSKKNGALILCTANGIVEFNGYNFKPVVDDNRFKKQSFYQVFFNEKTNRLIGLDEFLQVVNLQPTWQALAIGNNKPTRIAITGDSVFAVTLKKQIYLQRFGDTACKLFLTMDNLNLFKKGLRCRSFLVHHQTLYLSTDDGLFMVSVRTKTTTKLSNKAFTVIKINPFNDKLYGVLDETLCVFKNNELEENIVFQKKPEVGIGMDIVFTKTGDYFIATTAGLYTYEEGYAEHYTTKDGLSSNYIQSLYRDTVHDCLYLGTGEKGLMKLEYKTNYSFYKRQGLPVASLGSIIRNNNGKVLLAYADGYIYEFKSDTVRKYFSYINSYASLANINGLIFAGTWGAGVKIFKDTTLVDSLKYPQIQNQQVHACFKDTKGNIWIGTDNGIAKGNSIRNIKPILTEQIKEVVICFYELKNGSICVGTKGGAYILRDDKVLVKFNADNGFKGKEVRAFYEDSEGKIWIGTYNGGLFCYHKNKFTSINEMKNCMLDNDVFTLVKDQYNSFFISSNRGLWQVAEKDVNDFYYGKLKYLIPMHYIEESGILNTEFNGGFQNNYLQTKNSHFYFPTIEGVVMVFPQEIPFRKLTPQIDNIYINDTLVKIGTTQFERSTYSIQFNVSCVNFLSKYNVYFQHRLIGKKSYDWSAPQKSTSINLNMLPPGKYVFAVRALDGLNDRNPLEITYEFEIKPHFYEIAWLQILAAIIFVCLAVFIAWVRMQQFRKKAEDKERTKLLLAELELKAIHSQMNPHFVFNSLNSIKYFLSNNDVDKADKFIDHFSFLMRSYLDRGSSAFIEIAEKIKIISAYLELEKTRLNNRFEYKIDCDADLLHELIPVFLIQPLIENSVKHAFPPANKKYHLKIKFYKKEDAICCVVDDDGIGIEASIHNKTDDLTHQSKAMILIREKIALLKITHNLLVDIDVIDKKTLNENGTRVTFCIKKPL